MMNCEFKLFATSTEKPKERKHFWLCTIWDKADFSFFFSLKACEELEPPKFKIQKLKTQMIHYF